MRNLYLAITITIFVVTLFTPEADARRRIRGGYAGSEGGYITKVADLPDQQEFMGPDGDYFDLGWRHERTSVFWLPVWGTTEGNYVLYKKINDGWRYTDLSIDQAQALSAVINTPLSNNSPVSPLSLYWGWLIIGPLAFMGLFGKALGLNKRDTVPANQAMPARQAPQGDAQQMSAETQNMMHAMEQAARDHARNGTGNVHGAQSKAHPSRSMPQQNNSPGGFGRRR